MRTGISLRYLGAFLVLLAIEVAIALFVTGGVVRGYLGDVLVVVLIYCLVRTFVRNDARLLPLWIFLFAVAVELAQYADLAGRLGIDQRSATGVIVGSVFDLADIACYFAGCAGIAVFEAVLRRRRNAESVSPA